MMRLCGLLWVPCFLASCCCCCIIRLRSWPRSSREAGSLSHCGEDDCCVYLQPCFFSFSSLLSMASSVNCFGMYGFSQSFKLFFLFFSFFLWVTPFDEPLLPWIYKPSDPSLLLLSWSCFAALFFCSLEKLYSLRFQCWGFGAEIASLLWCTLHDRLRCRFLCFSPDWDENQFTLFVGEQSMKTFAPDSMRKQCPDSTALMSRKADWMHPKWTLDGFLSGLSSHPKLTLDGFLSGLSLHPKWTLRWVPQFSRDSVY